MLYCIYVDAILIKIIAIGWILGPLVVRTLEHTNKKKKRFEINETKYAVFNTTPN